MKLLALDLSTYSTGYALLNMETSGLLGYGLKEPINEKGYTKLKYPIAPLMRVISMANQVSDFIIETNPDSIVIEEVNRGPRISQKSLDYLHFLILQNLYLTAPLLLAKVKYMDSNGRTGWRPKLGLQLSDADKIHNVVARKWNKAKKKPAQPVINWKHLAARYVEKVYGLKFDVDLRPSDSDICDAICLGVAHLMPSGPVFNKAKAKKPKKGKK